MPKREYIQNSQCLIIHSLFPAAIYVYGDTERMVRMYVPRVYDTARKRTIRTLSRDSLKRLSRAPQRGSDRDSRFTRVARNEDATAISAIKKGMRIDLARERRRAHDDGRRDRKGGAETNSFARAHAAHSEKSSRQQESSVRERRGRERARDPARISP